jgi:Domain of unknown function (DUF3846)
MKALLIPVFGDIVPVEVNSLEDLQAAVGGYVERIDFRDAVGFVDEDGKDKLLLPNRRASALWWKLVGQTGDSLCGPVLMMGLEDDEGDNTDVPAGIVDELKG